MAQRNHRVGLHNTCKLGNYVHEIPSQRPQGDKSAYEHGKNMMEKRQTRQTHDKKQQKHKYFVHRLNGHQGIVWTKGGSNQGKTK